MNTVCAVPSGCRENREKQRGMVSVLMLCLMLAMVFLGRGICYFARQEAESVQGYREEMQLRLAAESAVEKVWANIEADKSKVDALRNGVETPWGESREGAMETHTYALAREGKVYIIACTFFRRGTDFDDVWEPHCRVKGVIQKVRKNEVESYAWLGWVP